MMQQKIQQNRRNRNSRKGVRNPYVGSGKVRETPYGPVMRLSFNREDLVKLAESLNEQGWVSFDILSCRRRARRDDTLRAARRGGPDSAMAVTGRRR